MKAVDGCAIGRPGVGYFWQSPWEWSGRIVRRGVSLVLLALMLNVAVSTPHVIDTRVPDVLQRLGLVYLIGAPLVIVASAGWRAIVLAALVAGHWAVLMIPISGYDPLDRTHQVSALVDRALSGGHPLTCQTTSSPAAGPALGSPSGW